MRILLIGTCLAGALILSGCSSASTASDSATGSPAASSGASSSAASQAPLRDGKPWALPSPSTEADASAVWCSALEQVIAAIGSATPTRTGAQKTLDALATYDELWTLASNRGYVTSQEAEVNHRYINGYEEMVTLQADGKGGDSPEMTKVTDGMNALTSDGQSLFDSSSSKISTLCGITTDGSASATPSAS